MITCYFREPLPRGCIAVVGKPKWNYKEDSNAKETSQVRLYDIFFEVNIDMSGTNSGRVNSGRRVQVKARARKRRIWRRTKVIESKRFNKTSQTYSGRIAKFIEDFHEFYK